MTEVAANAASQIRGERPGRKRGARRSWPCPIAASSRSPASAAAQARVDLASSAAHASAVTIFSDDEQRTGSSWRRSAPAERRGRAGRRAPSDCVRRPRRRRRGARTPPTHAGEGAAHASSLDHTPADAPWQPRGRPVRSSPEADDARRLARTRTVSSMTVLQPQQPRREALDRSRFRRSSRTRSAAVPRHKLGPGCRRTSPTRSCTTS